MLREGFLGNDVGFSSHMEVSSIVPLGIAPGGSSVRAPGCPQDYGGFVAGPGLVTTVDKAVSKDYRGWRATDELESAGEVGAVAGRICRRAVLDLGAAGG